MKDTFGLSGTVVGKKNGLGDSWLGDFYVTTIILKLLACISFEKSSRVIKSPQKYLRKFYLRKVTYYYSKTMSLNNQNKDITVQFR